MFIFKYLKFSCICYLISGTFCFFKFLSCRISEFKKLTKTALKDLYSALIIENQSFYVPVDCCLDNIRFRFVLYSIADPYSFDPDPDPAFLAEYRSRSRVLMTKNL
jgi:hypothetical protein